MNAAVKAVLMGNVKTLKLASMLKHFEEVVRQAKNPLIIDELGYVPFSKEGAELLFQVLADRHEMRSVIITTNMGFGDWTQIFGDPNLTAVLLDRVTHKAHIINCSWDSYRLKETLKKKK